MGERVYHAIAPLQVVAASALVDSGPLAVLDLTALANAPAIFRERAVYANIPFLDLVTLSPAAVEEAVAFIRTHQPDRTVLIQCRLGLQRSATVAAAWLVECGLAPDGAAAAEIIRRIEPCARISNDATNHQPPLVQNETS